MTTRTHYPRWSAVLKLPAIGNPDEFNQAERDKKVYTLPLKVAKATLNRNDHNQADTLSLTLDWQLVGLDPRLIRNANVIYHQGYAEPDGAWAATTRGGRTGFGNCRFVGTVTQVERNSEEGEPFEVELQCSDYTEFFLRAKPFGSSGVPSMDMTLNEAWKRIVSQTPGAVGALEDAVQFYGVDASKNLADLVGARFSKLAKVPVQANTDAWAVWQQTVGMCGLISFWYLEHVIVTSAEEYYRTQDPPQFIWGQNIYSLKERRNLVDFTNGVGATSFNPLTGEVIEAVFPPRTQEAPKGAKRKKLAAPKQTSADPEARVISKYDWWAVPNVHSVAELQRYVKSAYLQRSKQEFQGILRTADPFASTPSGAEVDFLELIPGDNILVSPNENNADVLADLTVPARIQYLVALGYSDDVASLVAYSMNDSSLQSQKFYVKGFRATVESDVDGGNVDNELLYCNRILVDGQSEKD